jgi:outer membrane protein assembly factor BamB
MPNSICNIAVDAEAEIAYVSEHNALNALHLSNGQELWRQSFPSINRIERILPDDKLLVSLERRSDFNPVFGLFDTKTREFIWAHQDEKFGDTCYLVEDVLAVRYDTQVHAYSVNSGERLWRFKFSSDFTKGSEALDGNLLAIWGKDRLIVIDASAGKIPWTAELSFSARCSCNQ